MKLVKKYFFGVRLILVVLVGILAVPGCGEKKKKAAFWPLALLGSGSATATSSGSGTGGSTNTGSAGGGNTVATSGETGSEGNNAVTEGGSGNTSVAIPTFSPSAGHYDTPQTITIASSTAGAIIYYTTDGSEPTTSSTQYITDLGHIWSLAGKTLKAIAIKSGSTNSAVATAEYSYSVLKTGQTVSYVAGDDGASQLGVPRSYTDNGDGTVTDNATGLLWQKCSVGQNNDANCSGTATIHNWATAKTNCSALTTAGKTWRLPSSIELEALPNYGTSNPAITTAFFPATVADIYWSSTTNARDTAYAWFVYFLDGLTFKDNKGSGNRLRCVSGETKLNQTFTDNADGTIKDKQTGLLWQKCSVGLSGASCGTGTATQMNWATALTTCSGLSLASKTWRLPSVTELSSIADKTLSTSPSINITMFPATVAYIYWSSTTYAPNTPNAYLVSFLDGSVVNDGSKASSNHVRCVSGP